MCFHSKYFTEELQQEYNLNTIMDDGGYVYCEIQKVMYGLKETGCVAFQNLVNNLAPFGYEPMPYTPGVW